MISISHFTLYSVLFAMLWSILLLLLNQLHTLFLFFYWIKPKTDGRSVDRSSLQLLFINNNNNFPVNTRTLWWFNFYKYISLIVIVFTMKTIFISLLWLLDLSIVKVFKIIERFCRLKCQSFALCAFQIKFL